MATSSPSIPQTPSESTLCDGQPPDDVPGSCEQNHDKPCSEGSHSEYDPASTHSCTQCLQTLSSRPDPTEATNEIGGRPNMTDLCNKTPPDGPSGSEDKDCDICTGFRCKAVKSCVVCLASYCDAHLRLHNDLHASTTHTLVDTADLLEGMTCSKHDKVLEVYCREERRCICCLCMLEDHKGHDVVSVAAGRKEQEEELSKSNRMIAVQETQLKKLNSAKHTLRDMALATEEESDRLFSELIHTIKSSRAMIKQLIRNQERAELNRLEDLQARVDGEVEELKKKDDEWKLVSQTDNDLLFLQAVESLSLTSTHTSNMMVNPQFSYGELVKSVQALKLQIEEIWNREIGKITSAVIKDKMVVPAEPQTRDEFLQYLVPLTLDTRTAHPNLTVCEDRQLLTCSAERHSYLDRPERFDWWAQVLCREPLTSRSYWEAEWTGLYGMDIAVSYGDICRKGEGDECGFGYNDRSWSLDCSITNYAFVHDNVETEFSVPPSHRIGVYLDYRASVLSFYSVSDKMILIHREETKFTQPLYAGFGLYQGSAARMCQPGKEARQQQNAERANSNRHETKKGKGIKKRK